jgi:hypothetical protein
MLIGGHLPSVFTEKIAQQKEREAAFLLPIECEEDEDEKECIFRNFTAAVDEHKDKVLRGLFALTEEEIRERLADFEARFRPQEPASPEAMEKFFAAKRDYLNALYALQAEQRPERLLTSSAENDDEDDKKDQYTRQLLPANPLLQHTLQGGYL